MTVLSDKEIKRKIDENEIVVEPLNFSEQIQPASLDIRLGTEFSKFPDNVKCIDVNTNVRDEMVSWISNVVTIQPNSFILANTIENFQIPNDTGAEIRGRSSLGRMGIEVHSCAGWVDPGFEGELVLEIFNNSNAPIELDSKTRVAQMVFHELGEPAIDGYGETENKYQGQSGAIPSKIHQDAN